MSHLWDQMKLEVHTGMAHFQGHSSVSALQSRQLYSGPSGQPPLCAGSHCGCMAMHHGPSTPALGTSSSSTAAGHLPYDPVNVLQGGWGNGFLNFSLLSGISLTTAVLGSHMWKGNRGALDYDHKFSLSASIFKSLLFPESTAPLKISSG